MYRKMCKFKEHLAQLLEKLRNFSLRFQSFLNYKKECKAILQKSMAYLVNI